MNTKTYSNSASLKSLGFNFVAMFALSLVIAEPAFAAQGGEIFKNAACTLLENVLKEDFGAMITALAGVLAIVAAAAGSFKGAWAMVFVSVGSFIYPGLVQVFFPGLSC